MSSSSSGFKSKTAATWIALIGGGLGLHRFYLHGWRDVVGWLHPLPFALGAWGVWRALAFGQDDRLSWALIPLLGVVLAAAMAMAIAYGLTPDDGWDARHNPGRPASTKSGWAAVLGAVLGLFFGAGVLMATLAFSGQRYFEWQIEEAHRISR